MIRRPPRSTLFPYTTPLPISCITLVSGRQAHLRQTAYCTICMRSEEHTSELQSQSNLVCRLLLAKKKKTPIAAKLRDDSMLFGSLLAITYVARSLTPPPCFF